MRYAFLATTAIALAAPLLSAVPAAAQQNPTVELRVDRLEKEMRAHAKNLEFEAAARLRDQLAVLKQKLFGA